MVVHDLRGLTAAIKPRPPSDAPVVWATFYDIRRYGGLQIFLRAILGATSLILSNAHESSVEHLQRLAKGGVTHISGTPSHWRRALMSQAAAAIAPNYVRLSGEIADQAVLDSLRQLYPRASIGHAYASTEAGVGFEVDDGLEGFPASYLERRGDVEMKLADGSLRIRSNRTASRYVTGGQSLADAEGFVDTGDMIEQRGDRCYFVGRRGGIINVGGLKVHPEEVEAVINSHGRVRMSLVKARKSPIMGSIVIADVVLNEAEIEPDAAQTLKSEILHLCREALPVHKIPATIRFVPALEVTSGGKLARPHA
jgi:acyl-coenzyme A synthetase/AMP-(fatty) acid ligase